MTTPEDKFRKSLMRDLAAHTARQINTLDMRRAAALARRLRARFTVAFNLPTVVGIVDDARENMSVTNDVDAVVAWLYERGYLDGRRLVYCDTEGRWDELAHDGHGRFVGFRPIGVRTAEAAIAFVEMD